jgi:hypothetical protein
MIELTTHYFYDSYKVTGCSRHRRVSDRDTENGGFYHIQDDRTIEEIIFRALGFFVIICLGGRHVFIDRCGPIRELLHSFIGIQNTYR